MVNSSSAVTDTNRWLIFMLHDSYGVLLYTRFLTYNNYHIECLKIKNDYRNEPIVHVYTHV